MLEYCTSTLHDMTLDLHDLSGLSRTWGDHLILNLEGLTATLSGDEGQASEQGESIKDIAKKRATQDKILVAAFTCDLMIEEQERQDSFQKRFKECIDDLKEVHERKCTEQITRMKKILETEKNSIRGAVIKKIQDKVTEFEEQLNNMHLEHGCTDQQCCPSMIEEDNDKDNVEDLNVFEVKTGSFCYTALVYNDDGDEIDEHGGTEWVSSANKSLKDGEYVLNPIRLGLPKTIRVVSLVLKFINNLKGRNN